MIAPPAKVYFEEIVGLRTFLALWVAIGHGLQTSGFLQPANPAMALLLDGHAAVIVFMIVSGFVITNLLMAKEEAFPRYITRRFFRLFPMYAVACIAGYLVAGEWVALMANVPWQGEAGWPEYRQSVVELKTEVTERFWPHAIAHLTMLHGVVPDQLLNRAGMTFLPAAWSISLEWQFYLVAPLLLWLMRGGRHVVLLAVAVLVLVAADRRGLFGTFDIPAFLITNLPFFIVGIASRLGFFWLRDLQLPPLTVASVAVVAAWYFLDDAIALCVWAVFLAFLLWHDRAPLLGAMFRRIMLNRAVLLVGEASYSLYLIHRPLQVVLASLLVVWTVPSKGEMLGTMVLATLVAVPLSIMTYFAIERPGMAIGRFLAGRADPATRLPA